MATLVQSTIGPNASYNYTSLFAWEAAKQGNLVTADQVQEAICYSMVDSTQCVVDGSTTDTTRYMRIYTPLSERHNGTRSPSKYLIEGNFGSFAPGLYIKDDNVRVEGLQFHGTGTSVGFQCDNCTNLRLSDLLAWDCGAEGFLIYQSSSAISLINFAALHCNRGIHMFNADNISLYNGVVMGSTNEGIWQENHTAVLFKNVYSGGNGGVDYSIGGTGNTWATSYSEDGTGTTTVAAFSTATFVSVGAGTEIPYLVPNSPLIDTGTNLSGDANWVHPSGNVDMIGMVRRGTSWDVGAFEYVNNIVFDYSLFPISKPKLVYSRSG